MIIYLSCTGNTRWAAETLASVTNDKAVSIFEASEKGGNIHLKEGERLGFCLPVHGWRVQPFVRSFIEKMTITMANNSQGATPESSLKRIYTYFLLTAGDSCGEYAEQLENLLVSKGLKVDTCCSIIMPESYVALPGFDVDPDLREAEKKMNANGVIQRFSEILVDHRSVRMPIEKGAFPRLYSRVFGKVFYSSLVTDKRFKVDKEKCNGCGRCVKACPVDNLTLEGKDGKNHPAWEHNGKCLTGLACYHYCPSHAINYWAFTKGKGQYYFSHNRNKQQK